MLPFGQQKCGSWREITTRETGYYSSPGVQLSARGNGGLTEGQRRSLEMIGGVYAWRMYEGKSEGRKRAEANQRGVTVARGQTGAIAGHVPVAWHQPTIGARDATARRDDGNPASRSPSLVMSYSGVCHVREIVGPSGARRHATTETSSSSSSSSSSSFFSLSLSLSPSRTLSRYLFCSSNFVVLGWQLSHCVFYIRKKIQNFYL